jgi:hypothetical protein
MTGWHIKVHTNPIHAGHVIEKPHSIYQRNHARATLASGTIDTCTDNTKMFAIGSGQFEQS